jgi:hypothetical protein
MTILSNWLPVAAAVVGAVLLLVVSTRVVRVLRRNANRAQIVTVGLLVPAAMGLAMSASTSYRYAGQRLGITDITERMTLCGVAEAGIIALTLHAWGTKSKGSALLAYFFVGAQAIPAFEVSSGAGGVVRIVLGPIMLALMLHKLLGIETKLSGAQSTGLLASAAREIRERLTARLGIGRRGEDSAAIARSRAADRAVKLASGRKLSRFAAVRLAKAIDAAQHGLNEVDAAAAEASIVARIVRRKSVADLHSLDARHAWTVATAAMGTDTDAANGADTNGQTAGRDAATKRPRKRTNTGQDAATKTAKLAAKYPDMPTADLAKKLNLSERTVRRHLAAPQSATATGTTQNPPPGLPVLAANGTTV